MTAGSMADLDDVALDFEAISGWIVGLGLGARPPLRFSRLGKGYSNLTFLVTDSDQRRWVLRRPPLGELLASAHDVAREYRILSALEATEVPAPHVLGLCGDNGVSEVPLVVMDHIEGLAFDDPEVAETLSPDRRRAVGFGLVEALAPPVAALEDSRSARDRRARRAATRGHAGRGGADARARGLPPAQRHRVPG